MLPKWAVKPNWLLDVAWAEVEEATDQQGDCHTAVKRRPTPPPPRRTRACLTAQALGHPRQH